jgi:hypothetical protein
MRRNVACVEDCVQICQSARLLFIYLFSNLENSNLTDPTELLKFTGMEPGVLNCCFLFPKCAKTHLRAPANPRSPVKEGREGIWEGRRDRDWWGGMDMREGR